MSNLRFKYLLLLGALTLFLAIAGCSSNSDDVNAQPAILVFTKTAGFRHTSIEAGIAAINKLGLENGFQVEQTDNAAHITSNNLRRFKAVVFLNTTGDVLNNSQQTAFESYIKSGNGFVGVHSASDTEYNWPWYGGLVGAYFKNHPAVQQASVQTISRTFNGYQQLPSLWTRADEWYNFQSLASGLNILLAVDESTYQGGQHGNLHPVTWWHHYSGGRSFYTAMGHTDESYTEPAFMQHLLGGIHYAMGR
jgi:uncharacterized protein